MKYGNEYFSQFKRHLFDSEFEYLSVNACWLFTVLIEMEHRFTGVNTDEFFRSDTDLAKDARMSKSTFKLAKNELKLSGLVEMKVKHYKDADSYKQSEQPITFYRIRSRQEAKAEFVKLADDRIKYAQHLIEVKQRRKDAKVEADSILGLNTA